MKEVVATLTQRGQVTVPVEVRRILGIKPRDKIAFRIEEDEVRLAAVKFTLETAYGSIKPLGRPENFKKIGRQAKEEHTKRVLRKLHKP